MEISDGQFGHSALQWVAGPVLIVPAQEPSGEGGQLVALLDSDDGRPAVPVGWIRLDVTGSWGRSGHLSISAEEQTRVSSENNPHTPLPDPVKDISPDPLILTPFTHQTPSPQSSPPPGPHFRSRRTPGKKRTLQNLKSVECTWEKIQKLRFLYLLPGVEDHDIIGGEIVLGQLPRNLLDLEGREWGGGGARKRL